jgi:hypothetical protein
VGQKAKACACAYLHPETYRHGADRWPLLGLKIGIPVASIVFTAAMLVPLVPLMGQAIVQTHAGADGAAANGQLSGSSEKSTLGICVRVGSCRQISKQRSPKGRIGGTAVEDASSSHYRNCQMPKRQGRAGQRGTTACDSEMLQTEKSDFLDPSSTEIGRRD